MISLLSGAWKIIITPTLIHRGPGDDARMIDISFNSRNPLVIEPFHICIVELIRVGYFTPDQESKNISPIQKNWILNLLMLATAVKSHALRQNNILFQ